MLKFRNLKDYVLHKILSKLPYDTRLKFYDLSKLPKNNRTPKSDIIQFYSSVNNIGNYTPVLGIQKIIEKCPDTWNIHDKQIDFEFINKNYKRAIIGGAGLLHPCFENFWHTFSRECKIKTAIWGIGVCFPDGQPMKGVEKKAAKYVFDRADLINVRDEITAEYYSLKNVDIGPCPTIAYLLDFIASKRQNHQILFSSHEELVPKAETDEIYKQIIKYNKSPVIKTSNIQYKYRSLQKIISEFYCKSEFVFSTRLHGAIISYGLGIPYVAIPRDEKLRAFHRLYGNGLIVERIDKIKDAMPLISAIHMGDIQIDSVLRFGALVKRWLV